MTKFKVGERVIALGIKASIVAVIGEWVCRVKYDDGHTYLTSNIFIIKIKKTPVPKRIKITNWK